MMEIPSVLSGWFPFWIGGGFISIQRIKDSSLAHKRLILVTKPNLCYILVSFHNYLVTYF